MARRCFEVHCKIFKSIIVGKNKFVLYCCCTTGNICVAQSTVNHKRLVSAIANLCRAAFNGALNGNGELVAESAFGLTVASPDGFDEENTVDSSVRNLCGGGFNQNLKIVFCSPLSFASLGCIQCCLQGCKLSLVFKLVFCQIISGSGNVPCMGIAFIGSVSANHHETDNASAEKHCSQAKGKNFCLFVHRFFPPKKLFFWFVISPKKTRFLR
ncbi:MAG: hypothetical protein IKT50_02540 [Clostridia bacterium]|nr:hypothetical protein [Clostridia bacterium]